VAGVAGGHHVLCVEDLLGKFWDGEGSVLLGTTGGQRGESGHEEVETGEGYHVDGNLAEIGVQLAGEAEAGGDAGHCGRDKVVQISVCGGGQFQGSEADVVEGFVVNAVGLVGVLDQLVDRKGCVVGLDDGIRHLLLKTHN